MFFARKISATLFAHVAYGFLRLWGWKRKTVFANLRHVGFEPGEKNAGVAGSACGDSVYEVASDVAVKDCKGGTGFATDVTCEKLYRKLLRNLARHMGELLFCFKTFKQLPKQTSAYPCRVNGWNFDLAPGAAETLEKMRHGGIFLTAHYGNYEAMGPWLCRLGIPLVASYIPIKPAWLNRILEGYIRAVNGRSYSVNARTPREFMRLLGEGKLFCLLADQDSRIPSAQEGLFMGKAVHNNPLPDFLLKHRPETPVYFCWIEEKSNARILHAIQIMMPSISENDSSRLVSTNDLMKRYNSWLESRIIENPAMWYGFTHRRFYSKDMELYR